MSFPFREDTESAGDAAKLTYKRRIDGSPLISVNTEGNEQATERESAKDTFV